MSRLFVTASLMLLAAAMPAAAQQQFAVGDRVKVNATGEKGTVLEAVPNPNGGFNVKVHLDRFGSYPVGPTYDTSVVQLTNESGGAAQMPADAGTPPPQAPVAPVPAPVAGPAPAPANPPAAAPANGAPFAVGQHVTIAYSGEGGTVVAVDGPNPNGGYNVKVHLDRLDPKSPQVGPTYDTSVVQIN